MDKRLHSFFHPYIKYQLFLHSHPFCKIRWTDVRCNIRWTDKRLHFFSTLILSINYFYTLTPLFLRQCNIKLMDKRLHSFFHPYIKYQLFLHSHPFCKIRWTDVRCNIRWTDKRLYSFFHPYIKYQLFLHSYTLTFKTV